MTEVDETMAGNSERLVMQRSADGAQDLVRLLLAPCAGPDVNSEEVLRAVLGARRPVLGRDASERDVREPSALGHVVGDAACFEKRGERGVSAEGREDGLLEGPGGHGEWRVTSSRNTVSPCSAIATPRGVNVRRASPIK